MFILNLIKKSFVSVFILGMLVFALMVSCGKNDSSVALAQVTYAQFMPTSGYYTSTYVLKSTSGPLVIPVGLSTASTVDRTINFTYSSKTAVAGTHYTAPATVTIKAGAFTDSLRIQGIYAAYAAGGRNDTVKVKLSGFAALNGVDSFLVIIQQPVCPVVSTGLIGNYTQSTDYSGGTASTKPKYTATISNWVSTSATSATITIQNIGATYDMGWGYVTANGGFRSSDPVITPGLTATLNWAVDPINPTITIASQNYFNDGSGMSTISATGTFSPCNNTFTIAFITHYAGDGNNYATTAVLKR